MCVLTKGCHVRVVSVLIENQIVEHDDLCSNAEFPSVNCLYLCKKEISSLGKKIHKLTHLFHCKRLMKHLTDSWLVPVRGGIGCPWQQWREEDRVDILLKKGGYDRVEWLRQSEQLLVDPILHRGVE